MTKGDFGGKRIHPDATMSAIFGSKPMKSTEMASKYFRYLKSNGLRKGRDVTPNKALEPLIGRNKQSVFKSIGKLWKYIKKRGLWK